MIDEVNALLPQTQCEECGYKGCRPYAEAMMQGETIDLCAPGGPTVLSRLERFFNVSGDSEKVARRYVPPRLAVIDQDVCIGCTKCISPCPTQAIVGAKKHNHFVLASDCTGCGLCVAVCPVDCIEMVHDDLSYEGKLSLSHSFKSLYQQERKEKGLMIKGSDELKDALNMLLGKGDE